MDDAPGPQPDLETSEWGQLLNETASVIIAADLTDIGGNVWIRDPPMVDRIPLPAVILSPFSPSHSPTDGTATGADATLRIMCSIVKGANGVVNATLAARLEWYGAIFRAFAKRSNRLPLSDGPADYCFSLYTTIEPGDPRIVEAWQKNYDAEYLAICPMVRYQSAA